MSSHLLSEVELVCDRVAVLNRGRLVRLGRTDELLQSAGQSEIVARGIAADTFSGAHARNGVVSFIIPTDQQRNTFERIWTMGGEVVSANPVRRSLEELFLELTAGEATAGGVQ